MRLDLLTSPYVFDTRTKPSRWPRQAQTSSSPTWASRRAARSARGPRGRSTTASGASQADPRRRSQVRSDIIVLCHGGPIAEPDDAAYVLGRTTGIAGFFGASSMERLPTEKAIAGTMRQFKQIPGGL